MTVSSILCFKRLTNIIRMRSHLYGAKTLLVLGGLFVGYCIMFYLNYTPDKPLDRKAGLFIVMLISPLIGFAGGAFVPFRNKLKTTDFLLFPASAIEKFIVELFGRIVLPWIVVPVLFLLCTRVMAAFFTWAYPESVIELFRFEVLWNSFNSPLEEVKYQFVGIIVLWQSILFAGSTSFIKNPSLKVILFVAGIVALVFSAFYIRIEFFGINNIPWVISYFKEETLMNLAFVVIGFSVLTAWSFGFFKLNEKQIV